MTRLVAIRAALIPLAAVAVTLSLHVVQATALPINAMVAIRSTSVVGPRPNSSLAPASRLDVAKLALAHVAASVADDGVPVPVIVAAPPINRSTCRTDMAGAVMTITIPDISYSCPVYAGGQSTLDAGAVTLIHIDALDSALASHPGEPGTLWIAAHRTSHGGAFAAVPTLADGAIVTMSDSTTTASYRIVSRIYVGVSNDRVIDASGHGTGAATLDAILRPDHGSNGAPRLVLQTCDGENHRWMLYADLVTG
ncbi:MAG: sortase [Ilumatobacteraceae bacterium]